jgi:hypothetical protein
MVQAKKMYVSLPSDNSRRWAARECEEFYIWSLLPEDTFAKMNGKDSLNEVYFIDLDENVYKMSYNHSLGRIEMVSGDNAIYCSFGSEEVKGLKLRQMTGFRYQGGETAPIVKIQAIGTLREYRADDPRFEGSFPALVPAEFNRQQAIVKRMAV